MTKLDRSRPYGTICGAADGRRYVQDGKDFDAAGDEWPRARPSSIARSVARSLPNDGPLSLDDVARRANINIDELSAEERALATAMIEARNEGARGRG